MAKVVVMPKLGLSMTQGTVVAWHKKEGDTVSLDEPLFDVETEKLVNKVDSTGEGVLRKIIVQEGDTVDCIAPVAIIADADEDISGLL